MLIISGGNEDFNISHLCQKAHEYAHAYYYFDPYNNELTWDFDSKRLIIDGHLVEPRGIFLRRDVFSSEKNSNQIWYQLFRNIAFCYPEINFLNRGYRGMYKLYNLAIAREVGLSTPQTLITNQNSLLQSLVQEEYIFKSVIGGSLTKSLSELEFQEGTLATPMTIQNKLVSPEMRIFGVGDQFFSFRIESDNLDYRNDNPKISMISNDENITTKIKKLKKSISLDFSASDFKMDPETKDWVFLEINSNPMFAAFDQIANGVLCKSILDYLHMEH